jgi:lipoprotein-anchoring transpeptidase ErfK/SrfK
MPWRLHLLLLATSGQSFAQGGWPPWADDLFGRPQYERRWKAPEGPLEPPLQPPDRRRDPGFGTRGGDIRDGGARPAIAPVAPPVVAFPHDFPVNSIVIDTGGRKLYYVLAENQAYEYAISVGREGFNWTGTETISRKQAWPDWYPPAEMRERDPTLPEKMPGGLKNPLGAIALYLGTTLYRIHGTNDVKSIGSAQSSGCFRMLNSAVMHLASITETGTVVSVVSALPKAPAASRPPTSSQPLPASQPPAPQPPAPAAGDAEASSPERTPDYRALRDRVFEETFGRR